MTDLTELNITELSQKIKSKQLSCVELIQSCIKNVHRYNHEINAIVHFDEEQCLEQAKSLDNMLSQGVYKGELHGIPIGVKDNYQTINYPTTACSDVLAGNKNDIRDAEVVKHLRKAGAIFIAKTNMHEWAYGATNKISNIGNTTNPWNKHHITGGSSGGSAAGLVQRMFWGALGSDTGGSIRIPSSACGVCGLKPTYGSLSTKGVYPLSWSLDVVGPMARNVNDLELMFYNMMSHERKVKLSLNNNIKFDLENLRGKKFGVPIGENFERTSEVEKVFRKNLKLFENHGAIIEKVKIPDMKEGLGAWKAILYAEASAYHEQHLREGSPKFSSNVRLMLESGKAVLAIDYIKANRFRTQFHTSVSKLFKRFDALLFTTIPVTPPKLQTEKIKLSDKIISSQDAMTYSAWLANYTGLPQISIPAGFDDFSLPVGLAIMGRAMSENELLQIGKWYQKQTNFHTLRPN